MAEDAVVTPRTCVGCKQIRAKSELLRIAKVDGRVRVDARVELGGRGAYLCESTDCLRIAMQRGTLERALRLRIPADEFSGIEQQIQAVLKARGGSHA